MANILIAYATRQGQTEKIARHVAEFLRSNAHTVDLIDTDQMHPAKELGPIDAALVAAPIHAGGYPRSVVRFVKMHREVEGGRRAPAPLRSTLRCCASWRPL